MLDTYLNDQNISNNIIIPNSFDSNKKKKLIPISEKSISYSSSVDDKNETIDNQINDSNSSFDFQDKEIPNKTEIKKEEKTENFFDKSKNFLDYISKAISKNFDFFKTTRKTNINTKVEITKKKFETKSFNRAISGDKIENKLNKDYNNYISNRIKASKSFNGKKYNKEKNKENNKNKAVIKLIKKDYGDKENIRDNYGKNSVGKNNNKNQINKICKNISINLNPKNFRNLTNINSHKNIAPKNLSCQNITSKIKNQLEKPKIKTINEETSQYIEEMKKGTYNILVAVRCRPLSQKEREISLYETLQIMERKIIILKDPNGATNPNNIRTKEQTLAFDYAFDQFEGQEEIFSCTTKFLISGVTNGFNATVFAYGATGAGKTYTMLGNEENPGIMSLTLNELFNKIKSYPEREYTVKLWYLEIYNENIRDLLVNNSDNLELREDPNKGLIVNGITEIIPKSSEHILNILKKGNKNRTTESTNANETSSRSHAILQIMVSYKEKSSGVNYEIKYGKLNLIDLAGSERASMTKNKGVRLFEGANINKSLLTLGNWI